MANVAPLDDAGIGVGAAGVGATVVGCVEADNVEPVGNGGGGAVEFWPSKPVSGGRIKFGKLATGVIGLPLSSLSIPCGIWGCGGSCDLDPYSTYYREKIHLY